VSRHDQHSNRNAGILALRLMLTQVDLDVGMAAFNDTVAEFADCPDCIREVMEMLALMAAGEMTADQIARSIAKWLDIFERFDKRRGEEP
jgi:hypothetical protein